MVNGKGVKNEFIKVLVEKTPNRFPKFLKHSSNFQVFSAWTSFPLAFLLFIYEAISTNKRFDWICINYCLPELYWQQANKIIIVHVLFLWELVYYSTLILIKILGDTEIYFYQSRVESFRDTIVTVYRVIYFPFIIMKK